jgi:hypothetical protein
MFTDVSEVLIALITETGSAPEMSLYYQSTWCYNPEDSHLHLQKLAVFWLVFVNLHVLLIFVFAQKNRVLGNQFRVS